MTAMRRGNGTGPILRAACVSAGINAAGAQLGRVSEEVDYRLPDGVVVRIGTPGQEGAARRAVDVARWLTSAGVPVMRAVANIRQPVVVDGRAVTYWHALPRHRAGTPTEVAAALTRLHGLSPPTDLEFGQVAPFVGLDERIAAAHTMSADDRSWLRGHLAELRGRWAALPTGRPWCVVHGAAWSGNVVVAEDGSVILLDPGQLSIGPPEWDLVHAAIECASFGWITDEQYAQYCRGYGSDVMRWDGYYLLRDIREFRMATMAAQAAAANSAYREQAELRLACVRGDIGPRPWSGWTALV
ncbi:aminoglycoside phosphotransferase family protein [Nocardia sp. NPDC004604]|uniref:phosphotransferase family protein n=1 Tax=Nocardia sp. NPDC004604 TaxID=3157013 RepID=UPI0033BA60E4